MATDWTFAGTWPYAPRWFDTAEGRLHYVDEGPDQAPTVVLLHGNPTWGYLYREFIPPLLDAGYRVVVPDFLGFGRSDKPTEPENYQIRKHVERLSGLLDSLDLQNVTLVPQDWGGLGLAWAVANPTRVRGLFIMNTTAHNPQAFRVPTVLRLFRAPYLGEFLVKGLLMFHRGFLFSAGVVRRERISASVRHAYLAPHPTWGSRTGVLEFPRQIPLGPDSPLADFLTGLEQGLRREFRGRPVTIVWAMKDVSFTPTLLEEQWLDTFPDAEVVRLDNAGHYLQEDAYEEIIPALLGFLRNQ